MQSNLMTYYTAFMNMASSFAQKKIKALFIMFIVNSAATQPHYPSKKQKDSDLNQSVGDFELVQSYDEVKDQGDHLQWFLFLRSVVRREISIIRTATNRGQDSLQFNQLPSLPTEQDGHQQVL
jgi:hypothetical protein